MSRRALASLALLVAVPSEFGCAVVPRADRVDALERGFASQRELVRELSARAEMLAPPSASAEASHAVSTFPYYELAVPRVPPLPDGAEASLRQMLAETLEARAAVAFEYEGADGPRAFAPPWRGQRFDGVPAPVQYAVVGTATALHRGAEWDLRVAQGSASAYWITVRNDLDERIRVRATEAPVAAVASAPADPEALRARFGLGEIERWSGSELPSLAQALDLLAHAEIAVLAGLPIRRAAASPAATSGPARECGRFVTNQGARWIEIYDCAFDLDGHGFVGSPEQPLRYSVRIVLHEIGHAISLAALTDVVERVLRGHQELVSLVTEFNRLGRRLRPEEVERFEAMSRDLEEINAGITSMSHIFASPELVQTPVIRAFALVPGAGSGITAYGRKSPVEAFAEAFSLFRADPDACRRISREVHDFFAAGRHLEGSHP